MSYADLDNPELHHQTKLYTGTGSALSVTFDGEEDMQPDWIWCKGRDVANLQVIFDSVRGTGKAVYADRNNAEENQAQGVTSFDSNGFSMGTLGDLNASTKSFVSWNWAMGTSFSNDASATSVGSIDSSGSINTTAGQSIISWTGSGSGATIAHGLGAQPQVVFVKNRDDTASWSVYTVVGGGGKGLFLNENNGFDSDSTYFNNGTASTTTFPVGTANIANGSSDNMIAYCFAEVKGYSRISSFVGNADTDGPWVFCGFRPSFVLIKNTAASEHWRIYDNKRDTYNHMYHVIYANEAGTESTVNNASEEIDFLSTGFKIRSSAAQLNGSGKTIFFMAFAEAPFVNSKNVPNNAR